MKYTDLNGDIMKEINENTLNNLHFWYTYLNEDVNKLEMLSSKLEELDLNNVVVDDIISVISDIIEENEKIRDIIYDEIITE